MVSWLLLLPSSFSLLHLVFICKNGAADPSLHTTGPNSFIDLYTKGSAFVDKTLLISEFLHAGEDLILLTYPPKWGKSVNIDMLRAFIQEEFNSTGGRIDPKHSSVYKIFTNPKLKISTRKKLIDENLAQHPVIHLSMRGVEGATLDAILAPLAAAVVKCYAQHHREMQEHFVLHNEEPSEVRKRAKQHFEHIFEQLKLKAVNRDVLKRSLYTLAEILHWWHDKKVFLFIDEYDWPVEFSRTSDSTDVDIMMDFLTEIVTETFRDNAHMVRGIVSGRMRVARLNNYYGLCHVREYDMVLNPYFDHFGFDEKEVDNLFADKVYGALAREAKDWYNGYGISAHVNRVELTVYNPYSINQFLEHKHVTQYWTKANEVDFFRHIFKTKAIEGKFLRLLSGKSIDLFLDGLSFSLDDLLALNEAVIKAEESTKAGLILRGAFVFGYLTFDEKFDVNEDDAHFKLPNKEVETEVTEKLLAHYKATYRIDQCVLRRIKEEFRSVQNRYDTLAFKNSLEGLFFAFPSFTEGADMNVTINAALNTALLTMKTAQRHSEVQVQNWVGATQREPRPSIAAVDDEYRSGLVMEMRFEESTHVALSWASDYSKTLWKERGIKKVRVMGVRVLANKTVLVEAGRWEIHGD